MLGASAVTYPQETCHRKLHSFFLHDCVACRVLIKYVNEVDPAVVDSFEHSGPPQVVDAMQAAVIGLCGHLPPQFFEVNVVTLGENLRVLMHSFMSTGYMYRHVADHLEIQAGVDRSLPSGVLQDDVEQDLAPGRSFGWRSQNWDGYAKVRTCCKAITYRFLCVSGMRGAWNEDKNCYHHLSTD